MPPHSRGPGPPAVVPVPGISDVERFGEAAGRGDLLIELPHGATKAREFEAVRDRLRGPFPDDLEAFFFANTDVGSPEAARALARRLVDDPVSRCRSVVVLRSLVPRTFIDCNRMLDATVESLGEANLTAAVPGYVGDRGDREALTAMHRAYAETSERAYDLVCGAGGLALQLHTYAPRSVGITRVDADIVRALRDAYRPEVYATWPERPEVEVICEDTAGEPMAARPIVDAVLGAYRDAGFDARKNVTYRLHPGTWGHGHARRYPDRTLCVELNRASLADPFTPFAEMRISQAKVDRMVAPLAGALARTAFT